MKQRKWMDLLVAMMCMLAAVVILWETVLVGITTRTIFAVIAAAAGIVLLRRWYMGGVA